MSITTDPTDPRLGQGSDSEPKPQNEVYLVLSDEERAKGFVRPVRLSYQHVGASPKYPMRDLTDEEKEQYAPWGYVKKEVYPESELPLTGKYWTQEQLNRMGKGCGVVTTMGRAIAETYARDNTFYSHTYCVGCMKHLPIAEFRWLDGEVVGS